MSDAMLYTNTSSTHLSASWLGSQTLRSVVPSDTEVVVDLLAATLLQHLRDIDEIAAGITNDLGIRSYGKSPTGTWIVVSKRHWQRISNHTDTNS